jgi:AraC family transcriptional activator of pobA
VLAPEVYADNLIPPPVSASRRVAKHNLQPHGQQQGMKSEYCTYRTRISTMTPTGTGVRATSQHGDAQPKASEAWIHSKSITPPERPLTGPIRQHRHETFFQILHIRTGEGEALFGKERFELSAGTIITVPPGVKHGFRFSPDLTGHNITIVATRVSARPACLMRFMARPWLFSLTPDGDGGYLAATLDQVTRELNSQTAPRPALLEACLDVFLTMAADRTAAASPGEDASGDRIARLNALIGKHYKRHLPATFYAEALGLSVTHLNRIARAGLGQSLNELLIDRLMADARQNLIFSLSPIQQIAYDLGYADAAYFTRVFLRATGETPGAYRKRERSQPHFGS